MFGTDNHNRNISEYRRRLYPEGARVRALNFATDNSSINDNCTVAPGTEGEVRLVDSSGTVHVNWDNGARIGALVEDSIEIIDE